MCDLFCVDELLTLCTGSLTASQSTTKVLKSLLSSSFAKRLDGMHTAQSAQLHQRDHQTPQSTLTSDAGDDDERDDDVRMDVDASLRSPNSIAPSVAPGVARPMRPSLAGEVPTIRMIGNSAILPSGSEADDSEKEFQEDEITPKMETKPLPNVEPSPDNVLSPPNNQARPFVLPSQSIAEMNSKPSFSRSTSSKSLYPSLPNSAEPECYIQPPGAFPTTTSMAIQEGDAQTHHIDDDHQSLMRSSPAFIFGLPSTEPTAPSSTSVTLASSAFSFRPPLSLSPASNTGAKLSSSGTKTMRQIMEEELHNAMLAKGLPVALPTRRPAVDGVSSASMGGPMGGGNVLGKKKRRYDDAHEKEFAKYVPNLTGLGFAEMYDRSGLFREGELQKGVQRNTRD